MSINYITLSRFTSYSKVILMTADDFRISADIGGTFTDIVFHNKNTGDVTTRKVPSTPDNPANAVLKGLHEMECTECIDYFIHGTTIGLNAFLQRSGARTALITTHGFQGSYSIQGNDRRDIYALDYRKPKTLVPPRDIFTVRERMDAQGKIVLPMELKDLDVIIETCRQERYEALAICFLFSFKNPEHEKQAGDYLSRHLPDVTISLSSMVSPEWREFARTSTTVLNAYTAPSVKRYLGHLMAEMGQIAPAAKVNVMSSNGGGMSVGTAEQKPIRTLLSGPVGGGVGGEYLGRVLNRPNLICVDMGGTSFDTCLIVNGKVTISTEAEIQGLPVQTPIVDIHVIGAGGGSIARVADGALRVGPESAGSLPGPACYGRGGAEPTVTDANVVLGRINPDYFSGGDMAIDKASAEDAVDDLRVQLGMDLETMAEGIISVADARMADAMRSITVARGIDPRNFSLVVYGGAGPLHAASIASSLRIKEVIIPMFPGVFSAWGMLQSDIRHDFKAGFFAAWDTIDLARLEKIFQGLEKEAEKVAIAEGTELSQITQQRFLDFRYTGQEFAQVCPLPVGSIDARVAVDIFHQTYKERYGHCSPDAPAEITNVRLQTSCYLQKPHSIPADPDMNRSYQKPVYISTVDGGKWLDTEHRSRGMLDTGKIYNGPMIIEETTTTTYVPANWFAQVHNSGHMFLNAKDE